LRLEEMYYYRVDPAGGFGLHVAYTRDGESVTHRVEDGDLVLIPYGYHSVSAPPGHRVYYLWAIAGDERRLAVFEDPAFRWIHESAYGPPSGGPSLPALCRKLDAPQASGPVRWRADAPVSPGKRRSSRSRRDLAAARRRLGRRR